jgi:signal transduction histidine kinase
VNPLRSVGGQLALALLVVVGGALAIVYLLVVPSYRSSLVDARLKGLRQTIQQIEQKPQTPPVFPSAAWIEDEALPISGGARVVVFSPPPLLLPQADSYGGTSRDIEHDPLVRRAARGDTIVSRAVQRDGSTYAEAAVSLREGYVLLVATPLHSELESVEVVRRRVFIAASLATAFAAVLGYALARLFARRIRRLESAAERIADGSFDRPVVDTSPDEVGQLARAFERMRLRLASLDRARAEFIANASHELRTPLFSLSGFLELLDDEELDVETREEFLTEMRGQVMRLTKLATDLLDLSRLDAGRLSVASESLDLASLGEVVVTEFGPRAAAAKHELDLGAGAPAFARGDEARVLQVARVLVENALVHTPPGTRVVVETDTQRGVAILAVTDDGPGIEDGARQAVFERFYRLGGSIASGSGLGLAIARELAELMGGRVTLESRPGRTRFTLELPLDAAARHGELVTAERS